MHIHTQNPNTNCFNWFVFFFWLDISVKSIFTLFHNNKIKDKRRKKSTQPKPKQNHFSLWLTFRGLSFSQPLKTHCFCYGVLIQEEWWQRAGAAASASEREKEKRKWMLLVLFQLCLVSDETEHREKESERKTH